MIRGILLFALALMMLSVTSCKYEDGPKFSLTFRKARVADYWLVEECIATDLNGTVTDRTVWAQTIFPKISMMQDGSTAFYGGVYGNANWEFARNYNDLLIKFNNGAPSWTWEITRLEQEHLWVLDTDNLSPNEQLKIKFKATSSH